MSSTKADQKRRLRQAQLAAALWSIFFVFVIFSGYFLLLQTNPALGGALAALLAIVAWLFARYIGSSDSGIRGHLPLFVALLLISAVGVANFMFLNFEGRRIFTETIVQSQDDFSLLSGHAQLKLKESGYYDKRDKITSLTDALVREIKNPLNCGQGPKAKEIMQDLATLLPDFRPLSGNKDCSRNAEVIASYREVIQDMSDRAPWSNSDLTSIIDTANVNKAKLQELGSQASTAQAYGLLRDVLPPLKGIDSTYRATFEKLSSQDGNMDKLPRSLPLESVEDLGEPTQLINLIFSRLDRPATYVYLALAFGFDWFMIYLFILVRRNRGGRDSGLPAPSANRGAW